MGGCNADGIIASREVRDRRCLEKKGLLGVEWGARGLCPDVGMRGREGLVVARYGDSHLTQGKIDIDDVVLKKFAG